MKTTDILTALIHFFNDLIAHIIPGMISIISIAYLFDEFDSKGFTNIHWGIHIAIYYVVGHLLLALHPKIPLLGWMGFAKFDISSISTSPITEEFKKLIPNKYNKLEITCLNFHDLRSIAMSTHSEAGDLGRRFMFISLFCKAMATSMLINSILVTCIAAVNSTHCTDLIPYTLAVLLTCIASYMFNTRSREFEKRALISPFAVAICKLLLIDLEGESNE